MKPDEEQESETRAREGAADGGQDGARFARGLEVRREVLGTSYVEAALARATELDAIFQRFVTETAWGSVWARPGLERRQRSLVTISILAALGRHEELALHLRASRNVGVPPHEIAEALLHVAVYAGVPAANTAFKLARQILGSAAE
jgi:4-carboxymuconolactone decarboxylase